MTDHNPGLEWPIHASHAEVGPPSPGDSSQARSASNQADLHAIHSAGVADAGHGPVTPGGATAARAARAGETGSATPAIASGVGSGGGERVTPTAGGGLAGGGSPTGPVGLPEAVGPAAPTGGTSSGGGAAGAAGAAAMVAVLAAGQNGPCLMSAGVVHERELRLSSLVHLPVRLPD
jgi:hypothetical protein